jgi:hypothetical protein
MKLPVWRRRRDLLDVLRIASIERFRDPEARTNLASWNESWHRTIGQVIDLAHKAPAGGRRSPAFEELRDLVQEAQLWRPISGALYSVSSRKSVVQQDGKRFKVSMAALPDLEFLDLLIERGMRPTVPEPPFPRSINNWFVKHAHSGTVEELDDATWNAVWKYARKMIRWQRSGLLEGEIEESLQLTSGLTLGRCLDLYSSLLGLRIVADSWVRTLNYSNASLMSFTHERAVEFFTDADPSVREVEASEFIELMTYRPGQSTHTSSTPFVPFHGQLVFAPALVTAAAVERTLLRSVASDPDRFGSLGQRLGRLADRVAEALNEVPNVSAMTRVKALRRDRSVAGDIDVLAVDASQGKVLAIEVKWPVEAFTLREASKVEADVRRGAAQLNSLRLALSRDEASLPASVAEITRGMEWNWFVATPGQLAETGMENIFPTSLRHLRAVLPVRNLGELMVRLRWRPKLGEHFVIGETNYQRLGLKVRLDTIEARVDSLDSIDYAAS